MTLLAFFHLINSYLSANATCATVNSHAVMQFGRPDIAPGQYVWNCVAGPGNWLADFLNWLVTL